MHESIFNGVVAFFKNSVYSSNWIAPQIKKISKMPNGFWHHVSLTNKEDCIRMYKKMCSLHASIVICTGAVHREALQQIANKNSILHVLFKRTGFLLVNDEMPKENGDYQPNNITSISFRMDGITFLSAVALGVYLNTKSFAPTLFAKNNHWKFNEITKKDGVLDVTSVDGVNLTNVDDKVLPIAVMFDSNSSTNASILNGFCEGLHFFNKLVELYNLECRGSRWMPLVLLAPPKNDLETITLKNFSFSNYSTIESAIDYYLANQAVAILPFGRLQARSVVEKVSKQKKNCVIVGIDSDLRKSQTIYNNRLFPFLITKNFDFLIAKILTSISTNASFGGFNGFGYNNFGNLMNGGISLSEQGLKLLGRIKSKYLLKLSRWYSLNKLARIDKIRKNFHLKCEHHCEPLKLGKIIHSRAKDDAHPINKWIASMPSLNLLFDSKIRNNFKILQDILQNCQLSGCEILSEKIIRMNNSLLLSIPRIDNDFVLSAHGSIVSSRLESNSAKWLNSTPIVFEKYYHNCQELFLSPIRKNYSRNI